MENFKERDGRIVSGPRPPELLLVAKEKESLYSMRELGLELRPRLFRFILGRHHI